MILAVARLLIPPVLTLGWRIHSWVCSSNQSADPKIDQVTLRLILCRYPYWRSGHWYLAQLALECDDVRTAYGALQSFLALNPPKPKTKHAHALLGRCYLRRGESERAITILEPLHHEGFLSVEEIEDLAAAHLAIGDNQRAAALLESIPVPQLSIGGRAALAFAREKFSR